jgi:TetR/AcrR family transcriptional repressor of nem operon
MPKDGTVTREKILDAAQGLILERGYAGMTVDSVLERVGITKGAFFYHFKSKDELARALIKRFANEDSALYTDMKARAEKLSDDPLQQVLIFIGLFEEMFEGLTEPYPGCLFASYVYEMQQFDADTLELVKESFKTWRALLKEKFDTVAMLHPPQTDIDTASLADAFTVVLEGAFVAGKALDEPDVIVKQLRHFKNYVALLFSGAPGGTKPRKQSRRVVAT